MSIKNPGQLLRVNYRITGPKAQAGALASFWVRVRESIQIDSADTEMTMSTGGYGYIGAAFVQHATIHDAHASGGMGIGAVAISDSVVIFTMANGLSLSTGQWGSGFNSIAWGSLAATVTFPFYLFALICSR